MTKEDILSKVHRNEMTTDEALVLLDKLSKILPVETRRRPPNFKVAEKSGWCSVQFEGLRYPCTLPSQLWLELLEDNNIERFKKFLEENKHQFRNKE